MFPTMGNQWLSPSFSYGTSFILLEEIPFILEKTLREEDPVFKAHHFPPCGFSEGKGTKSFSFLHLIFVTSRVKIFWLRVIMA